MEPIVTTRIESLAFGGDGVGRVDGQACFVPYSAPGDLLSIRVVERRESFLHGEIAEVREAGASRRPPRCRHFGTCGGCTWQHIDYAAQLEAKHEILVEAMRRIGGIEAPVLPVIPSTSEYGYRTRTRLHGAGGRLGYYERSSKRIVEVEECPILAPELRSRLDELSSGRGPVGRRSSAASTVEIELDGTGRLEERTLPEEPVRGRRGGAGGRRTSDEYAFHQVNRFVSPELGRFVVEAVTGRSVDRALEIVDLYCGNGNLSLPLAGSASTLYGFDTSEESIRQAAEAARSARLGHLHYACLDAASGLAGLDSEISAARRGHPLVIIADPPRSGLKELVAALAALSPELLVYVSCNPAALARDARLLVDGGMVLELLQPLDMFPQTYHLETVALFARRRPGARSSDKRSR